jgi:DNA-binding LytR/AlgR family response regulator
MNLIVRISGADDYSEILLVDGRRLLCDQRLNELESALPNQFARVHRSHVVNWDQVSSVDTTQAHPTLVHPSGAKTPVSRRRLNLVRERLKQK